mmetsp:Transcript_728/g.1130  ORF Transcript_728/g.1130 Transcript_728/m.1130 type:complete len:200 (+) Transcript_728:341-940(+)
MQKPTVLTAGGAQASTIVGIEISPSLSNASSKLASDAEDTDVTSQQPRKKMTSENRPPNLPDNGDDDDDMLSYDEEEELEQQMLLAPAGTNSRDDAVDDEEQELAAQLDDLYNHEGGGEGQGGSGGVGEGGDPHSDGGSGKMTSKSTILWICICFFGIMFSFVAYGLLLEYATSGGRKLHELSFFVRHEFALHMYCCMW